MFFYFQNCRIPSPTESGLLCVFSHVHPLSPSSSPFLYSLLCASVSSPVRHCILSCAHPSLYVSLSLSFFFFKGRKHPVRGAFVYKFTGSIFELGVKKKLSLCLSAGPLLCTRCSLSAFLFFPPLDFRPGLDVFLPSDPDPDPFGRLSSVLLLAHPSRKSLQ